MARPEKKDCCVLRINPRIYCVRVIHSCAYTFLDKAYLFLDGDPTKKIIVTIKAKAGYDSRQLAKEFLNELLSASLRYQVAKENKKIRELIVGTALFSVSEERPVSAAQQKEFGYLHGKRENRHAAINLGQESIRDIHGAAKKNKKIKDPLGISIPWEERYGKKNKVKVQ